MKIKKKIYIFFFVVLGIILQGLIHAGLEIWYINLLIKDFDSYGFGMSWSNWSTIHYIFTIILVLLGTSFGLSQGFFWWRIIYIEKRLKKVKERIKKYVKKRKNDSR